MLTTKLRNQLKEENFWQNPCIHTGQIGVEAEHSLFYGRKQIQDRFAIVPVIYECNHNPAKDIKEKSQLYAMMQAIVWGEWETVKAKYPKKEWEKLYELLSAKYPEFQKKNLFLIKNKLVLK